MYNSQLAVFVCAADCGSFTRAAERLLISPTAVMKQINALEEHLRLTLLHRTSQGIRLTAAGESVYRDAQFLFEYSEKAVARARKLEENTVRTFRVGSSALAPCRPLMELWREVSARFPGYRLEAVPFEDVYPGAFPGASRMGRRLDFFVGVSMPDSAAGKYPFMKLGELEWCIAASVNHRLAPLGKLTPADLRGESIVMPKRGEYAVCDSIRAELAALSPGVHVSDVPRYDTELFSRCADSGELLLSCGLWRDVHPLLINIPVEWEYTVPYGVFYQTEPSEDAARLISVLGKMSCQHTPHLTIDRHLWYN